MEFGGSRSSKVLRGVKYELFAGAEERIATTREEKHKISEGEHDDYGT